LDEESTLSLPCSSASDENFACCLNKESEEIESILEADTLCSHVSKKPIYEKHDKEKESFIDIHEDISCHQLADVIREDKREVDQ
jgi:hypothetical protein